VSVSEFPVGLEDLAERSAAPAAVRVALDHLAETAPSAMDRVESSPAVARALVAVLASSRSLTRVIDARPDEAIDTLSTLHVRRPTDVGDVEALVAWRNLEFLRIAARDLTGVDQLEQVGSSLAALARDVLEVACRLSLTDDDVTISVIGMGKLGGDELNYSSDIDVLFVGEGPRDALDQHARSIMDIARRTFRVDANLRPEGRDGPLVRSVESYEAYWDRWAEPWEFQALLKARPVAGDAALGERWFESAQRSLWSRPFDTDALRSLRTMKARAESEVARKGLDTRELKRGPGGIRDIEFTVQLLQLVHGHLDPDLRGPTTLSTLDEMTSGGYIDHEDGRLMADSYRLLRTVEHRLQLVDEQQVHTLPTDAAAIDQLARVMGRRDDRDATAGEQLELELRSVQTTVRGIHQRVYFRPLLESFATSAADDANLGPDAAIARLRAFGFTDARRTQAAIGELTRGLNRSSRLMQQLLPLLLDWLSQSPDPDLGLLLLRNLLTGPRQSRQIAETFRESPAAAQSLCILAGTSRLLGDIVIANPDLVSRLPDSDQLATKDRSGLIETATKALKMRVGITEQQGSLRRWQERNLLGIGARDVFGHADVESVGLDLTALAEATIQTALVALDPQIPFAVIGVGRFGGAELAYSSDLDVMFVHDGGSAKHADEARRLSMALLRMIGGATPSSRIYEIDCDLRPEGKNGPLSRGLDSFAIYWREHALTWERQAMTRARVVAGDRALGDELLDEIETWVWRPGLSAEGIRDIRRMKARIETERIPIGEDADYHLKLGRGSLSDIEFTTQMLQLQYDVRATGTIDGLRALREADVLDTEDAAILTEAYEFCEQVRNRWYLVNSAPGDSLPSQPESLLWLARSLDTHTGELREQYKRVTRRARAVVERVFYGFPVKD
jgi:glutamate-ammonia-ligase adenylyltransferase